MPSVTDFFMHLEIVIIATIEDSNSKGVGRLGILRLANAVVLAVP